MSLRLHFVLGVVWALTIAGRIYLSFCVRGSFKPFRVYVWASTITGCLLFAESACNAPEWYWYTFWLSSILLHLVVVVFAVFFAFDCVSYKPRLPESLMTHACLVMFGSMGLCVFSHWIGRDGMGAIWHMEQGLNLWVAGIVWISLLCARLVSCDPLKCDLVKGFAALYAFGLIASTVRLYCPMTISQLWALELWGELVVVTYWIYALRTETRPRSV